LTAFLDRRDERTMALLVIGFGLLLYLPFAGSYGLWDPWETHYAEVARQMTKRADFISLWWPGSARETEVFQTKPVLSFWLMSLAMMVARIGLPGGAAEEMALGHRAEWAARAPFCVLGALGLYGVYLVTARLANRRAGVLAALVTATCPLYALVARQAMTDMAFVAPMTLALALATLALVAPDERPLARRGRGRLSWPHHPLFYGALAFLALVTVPQLVVNSIDLRVQLPWGGRTVAMYGAVAMLPYDLGLVACVLLAARARARAPLYLMLAAVLCGLAVLGKGLAGLALPVVIFAVFLACSGTWRRLRGPQLGMMLALALVTCAVVAVPWHHAMYIRHGAAWWNEMFGDNHWRRLVMGRHGDRGTFEYFLRELGYGTLPWVALAPAALVAAAMRARSALDDRRQQLLWLGAVWFATAYAVVSLSMTKFHHYVLPAIPGLAIVIGCFLDDWLAQRRRVLGIALVGVPLLALVLADLAASPSAAQRFLWLFSYDYIYSPRGRAWPAALDFRPTLVAFGIVFAVAALAVTVQRWRRPAAVVFGGAAVAFTLFLLDGFMPRVAPFWSQKQTVAAYYQHRRSPEERLVAYRMFWRGETFYTKNALFEGPREERTAFDSDDARVCDEGLQSWIAAHRGRRHYFLFEPGRRGQLESLLPAESRATFTLIEQPSNKFALAAVEL
jgi:4-amino-4-deoxy-L-arabinose transferase-like glycosyltransferase